MPSALSRRIAERNALFAAHLARSDLVGFTDAAPRMAAEAGLCRAGSIVRPAGTRLAVERVPDGNLRLVTLSGIGDAVWARGVVRETLKAGLKVWLDTPFESVFWDFAEQPGFAFWHEDAAPARYALRTATYLGRDLRDGATVYGAMCERCRVPRGDFSLLVKPEWARAADALLRKLAPRKPVMLYRPLLRNLARRSVASRNPDAAAYSAIYRAIRERFHVISVAAAGAGEEVVHADAADSVFHRGELAVTTVAALMARAALVLSNPGMALVLAASLGTPVIGVFGGYEDAHNYADTVVYGPALLLDPIQPCRCMSDAHACRKAMDIPAAVVRAGRFCEGLPDR
jgi:hypothetical protein